MLRTIRFQLLTQIPLVLSSVVVSIATARLLGPEGKGAVGLLQYNAMLLGMLVGFGLNAATLQYVSKSQLTSSRALGAGLAVQALSAALSAALLLLATFIDQRSLVYPNGIQPWVSLMFLWTATVTTQFCGLMAAIHQGLRQFRWLNQQVLLRSMLSAAAGSLLWIINPPRAAELLLMAMAAIGLTESLAWIWRHRRLAMELPVFSAVRSDLRLMLAFAGNGYASRFANFLNYRVDIWVLSYFEPTAQVGLYLLAANTTQMLWLVSDPIAGVLMPHLNAASGVERIRKFWAYHRLNVTVVLLASAVAFVLADPIIPLAFGHEFSPAVPAFRLLLIGNLFACASKTFSTWNMAQNAVRFNLIATLIGLAATVVLDFALIPTFGIMGAAAASTVAYTATFTAVLLLARFGAKLSLENPAIITRHDIEILMHDRRS